MSMNATPPTIASAAKKRSNRPSEDLFLEEREAGRNVTSTMNQAIANLKPGTKQYEIIADVYHSQIT